MSATSVAVGFSKFFVVFLAALVVPLLIAEGTAALALMLMTLAFAAWYGQTKLGLR